MSMNGTIFEALKIGQAVAPQAITSATLYNGQNVSVTGNGIDVKLFDEIIFIVDHESVDADASIDCAIYESNTNDPATSTIVYLKNDSEVSTYATFDQITDVAAGQEFGFIKCKGTKRYLWAVTVGVASLTANYFGVNYILGKADSVPTSQTADFEIGF